MKTLSVGQPVEAVVESILPFGVFVVLDDGQRALGVDGHHVGPPPIRKRHLAHGEQILPAEQAGNAASDLGRDRREIVEAVRLGLRGHAA